MPVAVKTFEELRDDLVARWAAELEIDPILPPGDPVLAIMEDVAMQLLFLESLVQAVEKLARASTAEGADLDTWVADYGVSRLPATKARGPATFSVLLARPTAVSISPGALVQTRGGIVQYQVVADTTKAAWNAASNAYILPAGELSVEATVEALVPGASSNVLSGQLVEFASSVAGIDKVTNEVPIIDGKDEESDADLRVRFIQFINGLSRATKAAIEGAIASVQQGIEQSLVENQLPNGTERAGVFTAVIDDGTGEPPADLITAITEKIDEYRGFTIQPSVVAAELVNILVALTIRIQDTLDVGPVLAAVKSAIVDFVNALTIGQSLYLSDIIKIATGVTGVVAVQPNSAKIDGLEQDKEITAFQVLRTVAGSVTVGTY